MEQLFKFQLSWWKNCGFILFYPHDLFIVASAISDDWGGGGGGGGGESSDKMWIVDKLSMILASFGSEEKIFKQFTMTDAKWWQNLTHES